MHRTRASWSALLLALLLGILPRWGAPVDARAGAATLGPAAGPPLPDAYYLRAAASLRQALEWRSPTDRQLTTSGGALPSRPMLPILQGVQPGVLASHPAARHAGAGCRFPYFPTGPPSRT